MKDSPTPAAIVVTADVAPGTYTVDVQAETRTRHRVTASSAYLSELAVGAYPASKVIHETFRFLLEHEPNTSILANFDLSEIQRYFPEFPMAIARRLKA